MGTLYVLEAARKVGSVKSFINITTDKCYENKEKGHAFKEDDPLGGYDIYSSSKACAEILTSSYRNSFLQNDCFALASVRAGNVIGGGDWALNRLVPDCVQAFQKGESVHIRNPHAIRPWQHVLEPLFGYLLLGVKLAENPQKYSQGYNFGPHIHDALKVAEVATLMAEYWNHDAEKTNVFSKNARVIIANEDTLHEAGLLQLDIDKACTELGFMPVWNVHTAICKSVEWYKAFYNSYDMYDITIKQISEYIDDANQKKVVWSRNDC